MSADDDFFAEDPKPAAPAPEVTLDALLYDPAPGTDPADVAETINAVIPAGDAEESNDTTDLLSVLEGLRPRELKFLYAFARHGSVMRAAREAGYSGKHNPAAHNRRLANAMRRVQQSIRARFNYGVGNAIGELNELIAESRSRGEMMAAVRAVECKARIAGLMQAETHLVTPNLTINFEGVNPPRYVEGEFSHVGE